MLSSVRYRLGLTESVEGVGREKSLAIIGTKENAVKRKRTVEEDMFVTSVERGDTKERNVGKPENSPKRPNISSIQYGQISMIYFLSVLQLHQQLQTIPYRIHHKKNSRILMLS